MTLEICGFAKAAPIPIATMPTTVAANRASEPPARAAANRSRSPIAIWLKAMAKKRFHRCILSAVTVITLVVHRARHTFRNAQDPNPLKVRACHR